MNDFETVVERHPPALPGAADHAAGPAATQGGLAAGPQTPAGPQFPGPAGQTASGRMSGKGVWPLAPALTIVVLGTPGPQGSKRHVGKGVMIESSKKVAPWREAVTWAAAKARVDALLTPLDVPLVVEFCFTLARPKSAPKRRVYPDRMPDLSKLIRSTEDALTDAGVWTDDARVVAYHRPRKVYAGSGDADALDVPGAVIRVWEAS